MHDFRRLRVYRQSIRYAKDLYAYTRLLPTHERYGLSSQLQRNAVSVPSNISEGCGRNTNKEFAKFVSNAIGSAFEIETQLEIASEVGYPDPSALYEELRSIQKQLIAFRTRLLTDSHTSV